jgi:hypothetical protein
MEEGDAQDIYEVYLPLYSYKSKNIEEKSGLNQWNATSKTKGSNKPRPLNEIYIPIPKVFHRKYPDFFVEDINEFLYHSGPKRDLPQVWFRLQLPNGSQLPGLLTQDNLKGLESGSKTERKVNGEKYSQSDLGKWLLMDVLGLNERELVTMEYLQKKGIDSVRL